MATASDDADSRMPTVHQSGPLGPPRDTEGVVLGLYHHLWLKDQHGQSCPVNIPHTVLFQNSQPLAWYFSSLKSNTIMRKKRSNFKGPAMVEAFMVGQASQPDVCAWFSGQMTQLQSSARKGWRSEDDEHDIQELAMEFMTYDRVQAIFTAERDQLSSEKLYDGMLQRFVEPRDQYDFMFRVTWSPKSCHLEKRMNKHRLDGSDGTPLRDRVASFNNGLWHHSVVPIVEGVLSRRLEAQSSAIAAHIKDVTRGQSVISRMELFYKIDASNRIWLLYCSSLKLEVVPPLRVVYNTASDGAFVLKDPSRSEQMVLKDQERTTFVCAWTGQLHPIDKRSQVSYQLILQHWFKQCSEMTSEAERIHAMDAIPQALRRADPNMTRDYYLVNRSQPFFLASVAEVCTAAAVELRQAAGADLAATIGRPLASRPVSASNVQQALPGALTAVLRTRSKSHSGSTPRLPRPLSCSASSKPQGVLQGSHLQHWHHRVASASGAIVTPMSTGRVVPASPSARKPPTAPALHQQHQQQQQQLQQQQQQPSQQPQQPQRPAPHLIRVPYNTAGLQRQASGETSSSQNSLPFFPLALIPKATTTAAQLKAQTRAQVQAAYGIPAAAAGGPYPKPSVRPQTHQQAMARRSQPQAEGSLNSSGGAASPPLLRPISEEAGAQDAALATDTDRADARQQSHSGSSPRPDTADGPASSSRASSPQRGNRLQRQDQPSPQRYLSSAGSFGYSMDGDAYPTAGLGDAMYETASLGSRPSIQSVLDGTEVRSQTLKELSDAYTEAEQLTQALLQQANQLLKTPATAVGVAATSATAHQPALGAGVTGRVPRPTSAVSRPANSKARPGKHSPGTAADNGCSTSVPEIGSGLTRGVAGVFSLPPRPMSGRAPGARTRPVSARSRPSPIAAGMPHASLSGTKLGLANGTNMGTGTGSLSRSMDLLPLQAEPDAPVTALTPEEEEFLCEAIYE